LLKPIQLQTVADSAPCVQNCKPIQLQTAAYSTVCVEELQQHAVLMYALTPANGGRLHCNYTHCVFVLLLPHAQLASTAATTGLMHALTAFTHITSNCNYIYLNYCVLQGLEKDIQGHKKEIREREETISDKDKRIHDLKRKDQELEKFKFVVSATC
jgi:hypothetical protein